MIGTDEHMVLVISNRGMVTEIIDLGHSTLDGNELERAQHFAELRGYHIELISIVEVSNGFTSLLGVVKSTVRLV